MKTLLMVMNPRRIPECIAAFEALEVSKVWMSFFTEQEIAKKFPLVLELAYRKRYTHLSVLSDDTVPTMAALSSVLVGLDEHPSACLTAFCNLDSKLPWVNLTTRPFAKTYSVGTDYAWYSKKEAEGWPFTYVPTFFTGMCLTTMSLQMWERYPFHVLKNKEGTGYGSDWSLSSRLQRDRIPVWAPTTSFIRHLKETWNKPDKAPEKRLLVGVEEPRITWEER